MSGNVWEWINDWFDENYYSSSPTANPTGPATGTVRVFRGGNWEDSWELQRTAFRGFNFPLSIDNTIGFRCVFDLN